MTEENKEEKLRGLISGGAELAGGAIASALGFFAAGPAGAAAFGAAGVAAGMALRRLGEETSSRYLGPREKVRVGSVIAIAAARIDERIKNGDKIRTDDFFDASDAGRSKADEVAESLLLKCQREAEEKKIPYIANMLSNVAFEASVGAEMAHQLSKLAEALTYRQFCILRLIVVKQNYSLKPENYRSAGQLTVAQLQVLYECHDLYNRALINFGGDAALGLADVKPGAMGLLPFGAHLHNLMELHKIPSADLQAIANQLR